MGKHLAVEAVEVVEPHVARGGAGAGPAEAPLAYHRSAVAGVAQHACDCGRGGSERPLALQAGVVVDCVEVPVGLAQDHAFGTGPALVVASYLAVTAVKAGHYAAARRSGQWTSRIHVGEYQTFCSQSIDVRGLYHFLPVAAQVAVAQVVEQQEDDIRPLRLSVRATGGKGKKGGGSGPGG